MLQKLHQTTFIHNFIIFALLFLLGLTYLNLFWLNKPPAKELSPPKKISKISLQNLSKLQAANLKIKQLPLINPFLINTLPSKSKPATIAYANPQTPANVITLQGTIISPQQAVALIAFEHKTNYYHLNDNFKNYILQDIRPNSVVLYNQLTNTLETLTLKD